ncbi:telomerase RNA component interacting RNase [Oryzias melastigma]|uniref:Telomerase RNA component interacting RNase n=1 Tax=Oryzias melastigma TaxID=30732 RepID=A0A3B3DCP8_ORYME|nr:telomerase RNA component interacting RNase [Oryzias melastigma]
MDVKRPHGAPQTSSSSSGESSCGSPGSPSRSPAQFASQTSATNVFANDGSFMELFKKKMEEEKRKREAQHAGGDAGPNEQGQTSGEKKAPPVTTFVGKRRGGVFLKTGMVAKKQKQDSDADGGKSDAWSKYMAEVKKYKDHQCCDDDKTRPLVK